MFERNSVDNGQDTLPFAVEILLDTGDTISGRFMLPRSKNLHTMLNGPDMFLVFEPFGGERQYLARAAIKSVRPLEAAAAPTLNAPVVGSQGFDPYRILEITPASDQDEIRAAWHKKAMSYHPDRYANAELPDEVQGYLEAMSRRINTAYEACAANNSKERRAELHAHVSKPVYESQPRC